MAEYVERYSWAETDVMVARSLQGGAIVGRRQSYDGRTCTIYWSDFYENIIGEFSRHYLRTNTKNTERELTVTATCPDIYKPLAEELSKQLVRAPEPPAVFDTTQEATSALIHTTSGHPVALRLIRPTNSSDGDGESSGPIALLLPGASNIVAWFRAFLCELHEVDRSRVPQTPPRWSQPTDWYTPKERELADQILQVASEAERLGQERDRLQVQTGR